MTRYFTSYIIEADKKKKIKGLWRLTFPIRIVHYFFPIYIQVVWRGWTAVRVQPCHVQQRQEEPFDSSDGGAAGAGRNHHGHPRLEGADSAEND